MSEVALHIPPGQVRFHAMIGTGGIGAGSLFQLSGNHTLGREESRGGTYLDARDYCKLHIIAHNVKILTGENFPVYPIGKVGDDDIGRRIRNEMEAVGLELTYVHTSPGDKTLFGFCFIYPDGTGGNLTTEESACTKVDASFIASAEPLFSKYRKSFISLAAPEVPLPARAALLRLSREHEGYSVASFTSGELRERTTLDMLSMVDLLAINVDEAASLLGLDAADEEPERLVDMTIAKMKDINPSTMLSVTAGKSGSWTWDGAARVFVPALAVKVESTAGAGDAHIAGIISGLTAGLPLADAQKLGTLAGAFSVTSPHTIHPEMSRQNLRTLAVQLQDKTSAALSYILNA